MVAKWTYCVIFGAISCEACWDILKYIALIAYDKSGCSLLRFETQYGYRSMCDESDNKKFKQGHFEMGIHYVNFTPISNHFARKRAPLCPLIKCYLKANLTGFCGLNFAVAISYGEIDHY
ncbi:hypothetical protein [Plesiomonas shigelloides]|uniref:hypothetical protein n=1 Tax=Plesiomonas shigelloides TaxID=703 RepID=UPI0015B6797C|nr:hypothetical protein [Plesiomonas shigelloides]